jgi:hypothetical protein
MFTNASNDCNHFTQFFIELQYNFTIFLLKISKFKKKTIKFTEKFTIKTYNVEKQLRKKHKIVKKDCKNQIIW